MPATTLEVTRVEIVTTPDDSPDLSWLTQDYNEEGISPEDASLYRKQDAARLATYGEEWYMVGVYATAEIWRTVNAGTPQWYSRHIATARSSGLWGIESDSDREYFDEVAAEQLDELRDILTELGISEEDAREAIAAAVM